MKRFAILAGILMLFIAGGAMGKMYSLDECIQLAKEKDPRLIQFHNMIKSEKMSVLTQVGNFLPGLSLSAGYAKSDIAASSEPRVVFNINSGKIDTLDNPATTNKSYSAGYSFDYTLFDGLRNIWGYLGSRASKREAEYNYQNEVSDLIYIVKGTYYYALKARRDVEVAQDAVERSQEYLNLSQEKYDLGSASLSEVLKQRVKFGNDQLTLATSEKANNIALANLALAIGIDPNSAFEIEDIEIRKEPVPELDALIKKALAEHPSILAADANVASSKYGVRYAWGSYLPRLDWQYSKRWSNDTYKRIKKLGAFDNQATMSIGISFSIFDGFLRESNLSKAKVTLNNSRATEFYTRNLIIKDVRDAYLGVKLAEEKLRVTEEVERSASEDMDLVREKYNLGAAALWEMLDAQVSLKDAQFNKVKAEFDYNLALAQLQNAIGE